VGARHKIGIPVHSCVSRRDGSGALMASGQDTERRSRHERPAANGDVGTDRYLHEAVLARRHGVALYVACYDVLEQI